MMTFIYDTDYGEITKEFCDDTIYFAIADIIFDDRIYDIVKDKLTEKEMTKIVKNLSVELKEADISVQYYTSCLKDYFSEKDSEV